MYPQLGEQTWVTPYGMMLVLALFACWYYARQRAVATGLDASYVDLAVPMIFIVSTLGAKTLTFLIPGDLNVTGELYQVHFRLRLFGLLLFAFPLLYGFSRLAGKSFRSLLDLFALPVLLWLAILRIGCFLAGCCWGDLVHEHPNIVDPVLAAQVHTLPWLTGDWIVTATQFPTGSFAYEQHIVLGLINSTAPAALPVHPTQLYESTGLLVLLGLLHRYEKAGPRPGQLALMTLVGYCVLRFGIEYLRADNALVLGNHTSTQIICLVLLAVGAWGFRHLNKRST